MAELTHPTIKDGKETHTYQTSDLPALPSTNNH